MLTVLFISASFVSGFISKAVRCRDICSTSFLELVFIRLLKSLEGVSSIRI